MDRKALEEQTTMGDKITIDRQIEILGWVKLLGKADARRIMILAFVNNYYAVARSHNFRTVPSARGRQRVTGRR
jgi:hypothetical protein